MKCYIDHPINFTACGTNSHNTRYIVKYENWLGLNFLLSDKTILEYMLIFQRIEKKLMHNLSCFVKCI
jgi:hypothetical protein